MEYEKLMVLCNPLDCVIQLATEKQLRSPSDSLHNVFGVSYISDVERMLVFNTPFRKALMNEFDLKNEEEININLIIRPVSMDEVEGFLDMELGQFIQNAKLTDVFQNPYPKRIETSDGLFVWGDVKGAYEEIK